MEGAPVNSSNLRSVGYDPKVLEESGNMQRWPRLLPLVGVLVAAACFGVAASLHPGGYDWSRDYFSTLLRGEPGPARIPAIAGVLIFCLSMAVIFERLARSFGPSSASTAIQIGGIGSMVYTALAVTPLHDLTVTISIAFFVVAVLALLRVLYERRATGFLVTGIVWLGLLAASATIYYTGHFASALPWAQRIVFALFAIWLIALDIRTPHLRLAEKV